MDGWNFYSGKHGLLEKHAKTLLDIEYGFSYHSSIQINTSYIFPNKRSANENPEVIDRVIEAELEAGRYHGPYTLHEAEALLGPIICHPIGVVDKSNGKKRLVEDLSFPRDGSSPSLNSLTDISEMSVDWGGFAEMTNLLISAKPGTRGATLDWLNAYRNCAVKPDDLWQGCISWRDSIYVDTCLKFGGKAAPHEFDGPSSAFTDIATAEGLGVYLHWVDDVLVAQTPINNAPPYSYAFSTDQIVNLGRELGITFPPDKISPFAPQTKYIGFDWFWDLKEVRIPEEKRRIMLDRLVAALQADRISLADLRSLCGKLSHLSMVVPEGRSKTRALWDRLTKMEAACKSSKNSWAWAPSQIQDLEWWQSTLSSPDVGMTLCTQPTPDESIGLYCDASTSWGIGITIGNRFDRFKLLPDWNSTENRSIGWAEFVALEVLICSLRGYLGLEAFRNRHFLAYSDNKGVVGAWLKRSSRNVEQNTILNRILRLLLKNQSFLSIRYVESAKNPADAPSRGLDLPGSTRTRFGYFPRELSTLLARDLP